MTCRREKNKFTKTYDFIWKWLSPDSFHSYYTYFVTAVALSIGLVGFTGYEAYANQNYFKNYEHVEKVARSIVDTNHDGTLSLDEKIRMFREMRIPINIPGDTRKPTMQELNQYIENHGGR